MSSLPPSYVRQYNFTGWQVNHPNEPLPGNKVDQELNAVKASLDATQSRLSEIQRDDGALKNPSVTAYQVTNKSVPNGSGFIVTPADAGRLFNVTVADAGNCSVTLPEDAAIGSVFSFCLVGGQGYLHFIGSEAVPCTPYADPYTYGWLVTRAIRLSDRWLIDSTQFD